MLANTDRVVSLIEIPAAVPLDVLKGIPCREAYRGSIRYLTNDEDDACVEWAAEAA